MIWSIEELFESPKLPYEVSTDTLAFVGDAVFTLYFRIRFLGEGGRRTGPQHDKITPYLSSQGQRFAAQRLLELFTEEEHGVFQRGYNSKGAKKHGDDEDYRVSTALEAVIGHLFLSKRYERIAELLEAVIAVVSTR